VVYPENPLVVSIPPTSTTSTSGPTGSITATSASSSATITGSPLPPNSSPSDIANSIEEDLIAASLVIFLYLGVSWLGPILAKPEAIAASGAVNLASDCKILSFIDLFHFIPFWPLIYGITKG